MANRLCFVVACLTIVAVLWQPVPSVAQAQRVLRDWQVSCNPQKECNAETTATGRTDAVTYRFTLVFGRASSTAPWRILIRMNGAEPAPTSPFIFQIDAGAHFRFEPDEIRANDRQDYELLNDTKVEDLIAAFRQGDNLWLTFHDPRIRETGLAFSLSGVVASILWINEQQETASAEIRLPSRIVQIQALDSDCNVDGTPDPIAREYYLISEHETLFIVPCGTGAYNFAYRLYLENRQYDEIRPLYFADYSDDLGWGGTSSLYNITFDPETKILTSFSKGRGLSDCGSRARYVWRDYDFKLLEYAYWENCDGTHMPDEWPVIYRAEK